MGVSLEIYRSRIGIFVPHAAKSVTGIPVGKHQDGAANSFMFKMLPSLLLCIQLLLIGGIEPNPGPPLTCRICSVSFKTVSNYFLHYKLHLSVKNLRIPCPFEDCFRKFSTHESLSTHLSRDHRRHHEKQDNIVCPIESCTKPFSDLVKHLMDHLDHGDTFVCLYPNCTTVHKKKEYYRTHVTRYHGSKPLLMSSNSSPIPSHQSSTMVESHQESCEGSSTVPLSSSMESENVGSDDISYPDQTIIGCVSDANDCDPYPDYAVKDEVLRFYLKLEGSLLLPSSTVQYISEEVALLTELSHHSLKKKLREQMLEVGISAGTIDHVLMKSFQGDPVYNVHHKNEDVDQVTSIHLRRQFIRRRFPYVEPVEFQLGTDNVGKPKYAQYVPVKETLTTLLKDPKVSTEVVKSFSPSSGSPDVLQDFTDGSAFKNHKALHEGKNCIQLIFFQDAFEFSPFGPAKGMYKSIGLYFIIGNLPPEYRSKVDMIHLALMVREQDMKPSNSEYLQVKHDFDKSLELLQAEMEDLQENGLEVMGERIPVCCLFFTGDNLGAHQIGSFVQSFSAMFTCRYCPISKEEFRAEPHKCKDLRTPSQYDEYCNVAREKWMSIKTAAEAKSSVLSKAVLKRLRSISYRGVKPFPSPLNKIPLFHVSLPALPPCLAHDLFEGVVSIVLAQILKHFIQKLKWFTLETLNRRIKSFKCKGSDAADAPTQIKTLDAIKGHACENWTLLRLLPFMIGDLIKDKNDDMWQLFLQLKEICEYVCAPRISVNQVAYLKTTIEEFLCAVKRLIPSCLIPKCHYLRHFPDLILIYGPLIRLFTLRFESKHVLFKNIGKACKNFINITHTLAQKYQMRFAYDHSNEVLPEDTIYDPSAAKPVVLSEFSENLSVSVSNLPWISEARNLPSVVVKGITYKTDMWLILSKLDANDLSIGRILLIVCSPSDDIFFVVKEYSARNSYQGYYYVDELSEENLYVKRLEDFPDYYPLPSYNFDGKDCISLKHSVICM